MKHRTRCNHFLRILLALAFIGILSSCGTTKTTNATNPNPTSPTGPTAHTGHLDGDHEYRHLIAKANVQGLLDGTDARAEKLTPQSQTKTTFQPSLRPMFVGSPRVDMKLLIISAEGGANDPTLAGITFFAKEIGVPYDVLIAKNETLTQSKLIKANGDGKYQGIITTEVGLVFNNGGTFISAFDNAEWNLLWQYAREFNVRQVAMSGFPGTNPEDLGLRNVTQSNAEVTATLTTPGAGIFSSLKSNVNIPIKNAFTYEASLCGAACPTLSTTPILTNKANGNILGAITTTADSREVLSLTMNHNSFLRHTGLLSYDLINWVTGGIFIGERRMYYTVDIDDWYLQSAVWNPATNSNFPTSGAGSFVYQISATDVYNARDGVVNLRNRFNSPNFNYNQVFNAEKADPNASLSCANNASLSSATLCVKDFFPWVSHTFTHAEMDFLGYAQSRGEFENNINFAEPRLPFDRQFLVTGKHSGLGWYRIADAPAGATCVVDQVPGDPFCQFGLQASNVAMLQAAQDLGIKYLAANRGWNTHVAECDSCLITHPLNSNIKLVPRWPTNVFFNTTTPAENTSEFNYLYGPNGIVKDGNGNPFFTTNQTWAQILDFEADIAMRHILSASPYPHFVHQNNLREYQDGRSLIYDLSEAIMQEYSEFFSLPLVSQDWNALTSTLESRTSFFNAGASGVIDKTNNTVTITSANGGTVYVTGTQFANTPSFTYGTKQVSEVQLSPGQSISNSDVGPPTPGNILTNGGFEANLTAWTACSPTNNSTIVASTVEGNNALNIQGGASCLFQEASAVVGSTYTFSCQVKRNAAISWSSLQLSFTTSTFGSTGVSQVKEITGSNYSNLSLSLVAPANAANVAVTLYSEDSATIDACILTTDAVTPPPPPPGPTNTAPTIQAVPTQSSVQDTSVAISVAAQDADNDTLSFTATGLPTGVSISPTTGILTGKPTVVGTNNVTIVVSDGQATAATSFTWTITPATTPPPTETNLLTNPDFESGLTGWDLSGCGAGTITVTSSVSSSGNQSLALTNATACAGQGMLATPGARYTLSCDLRNINTSYGDMSIYADDQEIAITEITGGTFNTKTISGVAPAGTEYIYVYFYREGTGSIYIDNCSLSK